MKNFTGCLIVISSALLMKLLLNYFFPIQNLNETLSETVNSVKVYSPDVFEKMKKSNKIYLAFMGNSI